MFCVVGCLPLNQHSEKAFALINFSVFMVGPMKQMANLVITRAIWTNNKNGKCIVVYSQRTMNKWKTKSDAGPFYGSRDAIEFDRKSKSNRKCVGNHMMIDALDNCQFIIDVMVSFGQIQSKFSFTISFAEQKFCAPNLYRTEFINAVLFIFCIEMKSSVNCAQPKMILFTRIA